MRCSACDHENRPGAKFCEECSAPLRRVCGSCGAELRSTAKFCDECGAPVTGRASEAPSARKVVSIVFADLVGSTAMHERLDAESAQRLMERYYEVLRAVVDTHGGTVVKLLGDGVMAAFGLRQVTEDDALRAVRAGVAMQEAFGALVSTYAGALGTLGLRVAVNTGEVVVSDARDDVIGDPVNVAARLQEQGGDGDVVIGESTRRLVATRVTLVPLGIITLKGRAEAVAAYRVASLEPPGGAGTTPFVGREGELTRLRAVFDAAVDGPAARLSVLLGSPGLGKSRLIDEVGRRLGEAATVLAAHCDAAGGGTFAPLAGALRAHLGLEDAAASDALRAALDAALAADEADRARIAGGVEALLAGAPRPPEETFYAVRRLLAALARTKPVVLVIDDLQWAEPLLLDLVEHLVQWGSGVRLFVLVAARPELRDVRSSLVTPGGLVHEVVTLGALDAQVAMRLAANVVGATDLPAAVAAKVLAASEGNPLFVGELVRMLVQEGALTREGDRWVASAGLAAIEMPPTIHALLAARIERLRPEERTVLERAAVVGRHFSRSAVATLLSGNGGGRGADAMSDLDARLEALRRSELIERDTGWFLGEPVLRFHHVLIRDAAYRRLLKETRAELHARLADWIEGRVGDAPEHDETIGWHLERAHQHLRELGPLDTAGAALGERAARRLAAAGRRALARDDVALAAGLLGRAAERLEAAAPSRADLVLDWCEALFAAGDVGPAADAVTELDRLAADEPRLRAWHTCFAAQLAVMTAPDELHAAAGRVAAAAAALAALHDAAGEAKAHFVHAQALARLGKVGACEAALDQALAAARRADDRRRANAVLAGAPLAALWGPSPVTRASGRCLDVVRVLRITQGAPAVESVALACQGVLEALRGRSEAARRMLAAARTMVEELGILQRLHEADVFIGRVDLLEGAADAAERRLRAAYEGFLALGLGIDAARAAALLGRALLAQDRAAEAETLSHESERLAGDDLQAAIAWRGVRAEALARRGEHAEAIALAEAAVAIAAATDALLDHADARLALGAALEAAGRGGEAASEAGRARELWEAKGATLLVDPSHRAGPPAAMTALPAGLRARVRPDRRRVRTNAAYAAGRRFAAAFAARDAVALATLFSEDLEVVDHPNGATYGLSGHLDSLARLQRMTNPTLDFEPLATLGESLLLCRRRIRATGVPGRRFDVGAFEREEHVVFEVVHDGRIRRIEVFAADRLGAAIVRLYERYAEALPDGPARTRAVAVARSAAVWLGPLDPDLLATGVSLSSFVCVDHRSLGTWSARNRDEWLRHWRFQADLTAGFAVRMDDVLALEPDGWLGVMTYFGCNRDGGGTFENVICGLFAFGADGLLVRAEALEPDRTAEAFVRFHEFVRSTEPRSPVHRRVRPNAATRTMAAIEDAFARRDLAAIDALLADPMVTVENPTGVTYGREGQLESSRRMMRMPDLALRLEPLASLGDALCLLRRIVTASGTAGDRFDVGAYEHQSVVLNEVDAAGRLVSAEVFAPDRLAAALTRFYARYAETRPEGPTRAHAAAIARSVAAWFGPQHPDLLTAAVGHSTFVCIDHRSLGTWSAQDRDEWLQHWRLQLDLAPDFAVRVEDVLAAAPEAYLLHSTYFGVDRRSGGPFENVVLGLSVFGADGLSARVEVFEPDRAAEALARFDAIVGNAAPERSVRRRVPPNAATALAAQLSAAVQRHDVDAALAAQGESLTVVNHPTGTHLGREEALEWWRLAFTEDRDVAFRLEPLATLDERLGLFRQLWSGTGSSFGPNVVGAFEHEVCSVIELDSDGRAGCVEVFSADRLADAIPCLYERHAALLPPGPARNRAGAASRSIRTFFQATNDPDRLATAFATTVETIDHRIVGTHRMQGREAALASLRALRDLSAETSLQVDDVLALTEHGVVLRVTGGRQVSGGSQERRLCTVIVHDHGGQILHWEIFETEQEAEALARYDVLIGGGGEPPARRFANAATRFNERFVHAWAARDWEAVAALHQTGSQVEDRRRLMRLDGLILENLRFYFDVPESRWNITPMATRGERLALSRLCFEGEVDAQGGDLVIDYLCVDEVDADGRSAAAVIFDPGDLDAAYAELDARFAPGEAAAHGRTWAACRAVAAAMNARDMDAFVAPLAPGYVGNDHRRLAWGAMLSDPAVLVRALRLLVEMAPDFQVRLDHVRLSDRGALAEAVEYGTRDGSAFETRYLWMVEVDEAGRVPRFELYDLEQLDQARARFAELAGPSRDEVRFGNLATRLNERFIDAWVARDWDALAALHAPSCQTDDRRRFNRFQGGIEITLAQFRVYFDVPNSRWIITPIATRGERLALSRMLFQGDVDPEGGDLAIDYLVVDEVDGDGRSVGIVVFDPSDLDAAYSELDARWRATASPHCSRVIAYHDGFGRALAERDWAALVALHAPTLVARDGRLVGWDTLTGPAAFVRALQAMVDLAPDANGRLDHIRVSARGLISEVTWMGTRDGGEFESPFVWVVELDAEGRARRLDFYDPHRLEQAFARFAELQDARARIEETATHPPSDAPAAFHARRAAPAVAAARDRGARIAKPNAAAAMIHRWQAAFTAGCETGNWDAARDLCAEGMVWHDRRRMALVSGDRDLMIASARERARTGAQIEARLLGTAGERVAIFRTLWAGGPPDGRFEIEYVSVVEVDAAGLAVAMVFYDVPDVGAAQREAWARWSAIDPTVAPAVAHVSAAADAFNVQDREGVSGQYTEDLIVEDHRRTGFGRLEGADAYVDSIAALWNLTKETRIEFGWFWAAVRRDGAVVSIRRFGELLDGGAFESEYLYLFLVANGRATRVELFELDALDQALARFEEIGASRAEQA